MIRACRWRWVVSIGAKSLDENLMELDLFNIAVLSARTPEVFGWPWDLVFVPFGCWLIYIFLYGIAGGDRLDQTGATQLGQIHDEVLALTTLEPSRANFSFYTYHGALTKRRIRHDACLSPTKSLLLLKQLTRFNLRWHLFALDFLRFTYTLVAYYRTKRILNHCFFEPNAPSKEEWIAIGEDEYISTRSIR